MTPNIPENTIVAVMAEGKQHAIAIGFYLSFDVITSQA